MTYQHCRFLKDLFAITLGGGASNNPGRYLVLLPPINGATAITGSPYFTENPGDPYKAWDAPRPSITCRGSSSPGDSNTTTGHPMRPISPAMGDHSFLGKHRRSSPIDPGFFPDLPKPHHHSTSEALIALALPLLASGRSWLGGFVDNKNRDNAGHYATPYSRRTATAGAG
jgi:hypothetical protein